jgi:cell division protein FtsL
MKDFKLDNHPKIATGFKTPEGYFDTLYDRIELPSEPINETKVITFASYRKKLLYAVAAVLVIAVSIPLITNALQTQKTIPLSNESIEDYLSYSRTVSAHEMAELLSYEDIQSLEVDLNIDNKEIESLLTDSDYIEDYLID